MSPTPALTWSLELFVGAEGLALGAARAAFEHRVVLDWNGNACRGFRRNKTDGVDYIRDWHMIECGVRGFDFEPYSGKSHVVFGGPHIQDALLYDQWITGEYWEPHWIALSKRPEEPVRIGRGIEGLPSDISLSVNAPRLRRFISRANRRRRDTRQSYESVDAVEFELRRQLDSIDRGKGILRIPR